MKLEVWKDKRSFSDGHIRLCIPNSQCSIGNKEYQLLGTTTLNIQEPKKKKLVYQWCYEKRDGTLEITGATFGIKDTDTVKKFCSCMAFKEGGKLFPLMESEKEIDV
jgi:hypothetical protein